MRDTADMRDLLVSQMERRTKARAAGPPLGKWAVHSWLQAHVERREERRLRSWADLGLSEKRREGKGSGAVKGKG